jgi:cysteinyl-tRNA synthetase
LDLAFPHHENERAQAVAIGRDFARHWVHNGWVMVGKEKMSKSLGNYVTLTDLLERTDSRAYRLLVLRAHYRSPIEVTQTTLADAEEGLARLDALARRFGLDPSLATVRAADARSAGGDGEALDAFVERMDDDLDTPGALAGIFDLVRRAHAEADAGRTAEAERLARTVAVLAGALGLELSGGEDDVDEDALQLVAERDAARAERDWARADAIRSELDDAGWVVEDTPGGARLHRRRD